MASPEPVHRQRMRAGFEHCVRSTGIANLRKKSLEVHRFRCRIWRWIVPERRVIRDRSEQAGLRPGGLHDRIHDRSSGRLSVRAGHRNELQRVRGMPQEIRCGDRQRLARFSNLNPHHTRRNPAGSWLFARNGHRASLEGVLNELVSVCLGPVQGKKKRARPHLPRITGHLMNFQATRVRRQSRLHALQNFAQLSSAVR